MKKITLILLLCVALNSSAQQVQSPNHNCTLSFQLAEKGSPSYTVTYKNKPVVLSSLLGIYLKDNADLASHFTVSDTKTSSVNESWKPVLGENPNTLINTMSWLFP